MKYIVYLKLSFLILANMSLEPTNKYAVDFTSWVHNIWLNLTWPWLVLDPSFKFYWVFTLHKHLGFPNFFVLLIFLVFWVEFVLCFVPDVASVSVFCTRCCQCLWLSILDWSFGFVKTIISLHAFWILYLYIHN
jgi:hypothetical protein